MRTIRVDAIHRAFESARDIEAAIRPDRHRRGVHDAGDVGFARAGTCHAKDRDWCLLPSRTAIRDVKIALAIEHRVIDLVQTGRPGPANRDVDRFAHDIFDTDGSHTAFQLRRQRDDNTNARCKQDTRRLIADGDVGQFVYRKPMAAKSDPSAFDSAKRSDRGNGGTDHGQVQSSK